MRRDSVVGEVIRSGVVVLFLFIMCQTAIRLTRRGDSNLNLWLPSLRAFEGFSTIVILYGWALWLSIPLRRFRLVIGFVSIILAVFCWKMGYRHYPSTFPVFEDLHRFVIIPSGWAIAVSVGTALLLLLTGTAMIFFGRFLDKAHCYIQGSTDSLNKQDPWDSKVCCSIETLYGIIIVLISGAIWLRVGNHYFFGLCELFGSLFFSCLCYCVRRKKNI